MQIEFIAPSINISIIISFVIGLFFVVQGFGQLFTGKAFGKSYNNYTVESVKKFARPSGVVMILIGLSFILGRFIVFNGDAEHSVWYSYGAVLVFLVILIIISALTLKKKEKND